MTNFSFNFNFAAPFSRAMSSFFLLYNFNSTIGQFRNYHIFNPLKNINNKVPNKNLDIQFKEWLINNKPEKEYLNSAECKENVYTENKKRSGIYLWLNTINNKYYIGSANNLSKRFSQYYSEKYLIKTSLLIHNALLKNTHDKFSLYILEYCEPKNLIEREQYYLDLLSPQYNILKIAGSSFGFKHTLETLTKISLAKTGNTFSEEHKTKLSEISRGENNSFYGKTHTAETLTKMALAKKGVNNPMYGRTGVNNKLSKKVYIYNNKESLILFKIFSSYAETAIHFNCHERTINRYIDTQKLYKKEWLLSSKEI